MPIKSGPASSQASKKQQQSISSFFSSKPSTAPPRPPPSSISSNTRPSTSAQPLSAAEPPPSSLDFPEDDALFVQSDDEKLSQDTSRPQNGTSKRMLDEDETAADSAANTQPPVKKLRLASSALGTTGDNAVMVGSPPRPKPALLKIQSSVRVTDRTSKYLFKSGPKEANTEDDEEDVDEETIIHRKRLHERFVKKLGRPDSMAEIKRRNHILDGDATPDAEAEGDEDDEQEAEPEPKARGRKGAAAPKKGAAKLTPMEKQFLDIKRKHMDTLLVYEVGYKFRFMGEDARVAAKELGIVCIPGKFRYDEHPSEAHLNRFAGASIPVHRLHVHVKRLVAAGHKVGVVRQIETAALKAVGDNRNTPFIRKLTNLYTKGTYVDDVDGLDVPVGGISGGAPAAGYLLCLAETNAKGWGTDEKVQVGIVAVQPATGDIIYDDFGDGFMRTEIETRLLHIAPCEFLIVGDLSPATEKLVQHLSGSKTNVFGDQVRVERVDKPKTIIATSYNHVSNFYAEKLKDRENGADNTVLDKVHKLSDLVTVCLSSMINHLTEYGLEHVFDLTKNFSSFSARSHMLLNGNTLNSLEIYRNQTDNTERGSLFSIMDQTQTRFGQRLLRKWCGRPLLDKVKLEERVNAVEELKEGERTIEVDKLNHILSKVRIDLEKTLIRVYYKKCTRPELLNFLQALAKVATEYAYVKDKDTSFKSSLLKDAVGALPHILGYLNSVLEKINAQAAKEDDKYAFFREDYETELITEHKVGIACVEHDLDAHRKDAAQKLKKVRVEYATVSGIDYLIEVDNSYCKNVPASWVKISGTKKVSRFHTPDVLRWIRERDQHKEALAAACDDAFHALLEDISTQYQALRDTIQALATLDCLLSLSSVAQRPDYCKPTFVTTDANATNTTLNIVAGRHPMVEQLLTDAYVPNDVDLSTSRTRALLITGPNMGGKSSYVRSIALIAIMAQIGSYVPAASAELSLLDAVYTRMGAFDNMMRGESTFMVELSETSDLLKAATPRSLIVLDELGRGTSTHDGVAIAQAVLEHCVREVGCLTLFITHYQNLASMETTFEGEMLRNVHVRFEEGDGKGDGEAEPDGCEDDAGGSETTETHNKNIKPDEDITFLYSIAPGVAHRSYGLNVARLAGLPRDVIDLAREKSKELEETVVAARLRSLGRRMLGLFSGEVGRDDGDEGKGDGNGGFEVLLEGMEQL